MIVARLIQAALTVGSGINPVAFIGQRTAKHPQNGFIVFDYQDAFVHSPS